MPVEDTIKLLRQPSLFTAASCVSQTEDTRVSSHSQKDLFKFSDTLAGNQAGPNFSSVSEHFILSP